MEQYYETPKGRLSYVIKENYATITSYQGEDEVVNIPSVLCDVFVERIGKKAFMNNKWIQKIVLPDTITEIYEWAFAYCAMLEEVEFPGKAVTISKGIFLGDVRLVKVAVRDDAAGTLKEDRARLLAALPSLSDSEYLFAMEEAGTKEWFLRYDERIKKFLEEDDVHGYTQMILCGEEDLNCSLDLFVEEKRKKKARFCFLRLMHDTGLAPSYRKTLEQYLMSHVVGSPSMEAWLVLREEKGHCKEYYELYERLGGITADNYEATISDLKDKHPEMKAYFIRKHTEQVCEQDAFDAFSL